MGKNDGRFCYACYGVNFGDLGDLGDLKFFWDTVVG